MTVLGDTWRTWRTALREARDPNAPPVHGWQLPYIGCGIELVKKGAPMTLEAHQRYGDTYTLYAGGTLITFSRDEAFKSHLYSADVHEVSFVEALRVFPGLGDVVTLGATGPEHANVGLQTLRDLLGPRVRDAPGLLDEELRRRLGSMPSHGTLSPFSFFEPCIVQLTAALLGGLELARDDAFVRRLVELDEAILKIVRSPIPSRAVREGVRIRGRLVDRIRVEIRRRRETEDEEPDRPRDFIDAMMSTTAPSGAPFSDEAVALDLVGYMFATTANTPAAAAWCLVHILADPDLHARVRDEQTATTERHGPLLDGAALRDMKLLSACLHETLRLYAPGLHVRIARTPTAAGRYRIPANRLIAYSPYALHHDPVHYTDPLVFDPDRFLDGPRLPGGPPRSSHYVPFGRGPHACLGKNLARQEVIASIARMLRDWEMDPLEPVDPDDPSEIVWATNGMAAPHPRRTIRYRRRSASARI